MENQDAGRLSTALQAAPGLLSKNLAPEIQDVWSRRGASEENVLQNASHMAHISELSPPPVDRAARDTALI